MAETPPATRAAPADTAAPHGTPEAAILSLLRAGGPDGSISPGDAARHLAAHLAATRGEAASWRPLLAAIRGAGARLATQGQIDILRKGRPIPADAIRGVVRFRLKREQRRD